MFQTAVLASGSKGNCILVRTNETKILIDAGLSGKKIWNAMEKLSLKEEKLNALFISHDHSDHIKGAGIVARKMKIPLYITQETYRYGQKHLGIIDSYLTHFEVGDRIVVGDIMIQTFPSSHDAVDSCNFVITQAENESAKLAVCTDLGYSTRLTLNRISGTTTLILESNHDEDMLHNGPYPWDLKQRIRSNKGHLSNKQAVGIISSILHPGLKNIVLAHLSEENNSPELAERTSREFLESVRYDGKLYVADQYEPTPLLDI
jgi:phosphoribosyl 1,2-cyclic phosphodiesterase